jgi:hypothetical protein
MAALGAFGATSQFSVIVNRTSVTGTPVRGHGATKVPRAAKGDDYFGSMMMMTSASASGGDGGVAGSLSEVQRGAPSVMSRGCSDRISHILCPPRARARRARRQAEAHRPRRAARPARAAWTALRLLADVADSIFRGDDGARAIGTTDDDGAGRAQPATGSRRQRSPNSAALTWIRN